MVEIFDLARIYFETVTNSEEHLDLLDDVNVIDAQRWFPKHKPPMNFETLFLLELLVIFSCELIHVFLSWKMKTRIVEIQRWFLPLRILWVPYGKVGLSCAMPRRSHLSKLFVIHLQFAQFLHAQISLCASGLII